MIYYLEFALNNCGFLQNNQGKYGSFAGKLQKKAPKEKSNGA